MLSAPDSLCLCPQASKKKGSKSASAAAAFDVLQDEAAAPQENGHMPDTDAAAQNGTTGELAHMLVACCRLLPAA